MSASAPRASVPTERMQAGSVKAIHEPLRSGSGPRGSGFGLWLTVYLSGAALVVLILAHLVAEHYLVPAQGIRASVVQERLQASLWWWVVDLGLLVAALVHGLAGIYRLLDEGRHLRGARRWVAVGVLTVLGLVGLQAGVDIFRAFLGVRG